MKVFLFVSVFILASFLFAQEPEMKTRYYPVDPSRWVEVAPLDGADPFGAKKDTILSDDFLEDLFKRYGVTFPEGASVTYDASVSQLVVVNTPLNIGIIEKVLTTLGPDTRQVYVNIWGLSFPSEALQAKERELGRPLRDVEYLGLWKKGVGKQSFSQGIRTLDGVNAILETERGENPDDDPALTLNVTPTVDRHGRIFVVLHPAQNVTPDGEKVSSERRMSWGVATSVALFSEESIVLGHSSSKEGDRRLVWFLTARTTRVLWKNDQ